MMKRKALFIGVNEYEDRQIRNLNYSLSDAHALKTFFEMFGYETDVLENPCKSDVFRAVKGMTEDLSDGDLFFFYFAGHGWTTASGKHLLFCKDDMYEDLRDDDAGISFDKLKRKTAGNYNRAFVLDACRSDFITGTRGEDSTTRDLRPIGELVMDAPARSSLAVLRSCSQYEHALEIDSRKHGLFTLAMMDVLRASRDAGEELLFGEPLCDAITDKMLYIANEEGIAAAQTPEFAKSGAAQVLVAGRKALAGIPPSANRPAAAPRVVCPSCGFRNLEEQTFRCRICGRDYLCKRHYDESGNCCRDCAAGARTKMVQLWKGGPYWATTNIGAENPEEYGYYFWWGDTIGCKFEDGVWVASDGSSADFRFGDNPVSKETFDMSLLVLLAGGWITGAKSPSISFSLEPEHDAAHVQWGGEWRMPTGRELGSLCSKCDWIWTSMNGVNGYVVRGRGDYASASIFLPANFRGDGSSSSDVGSYGSYWSSSTEDDDSCSLYFNSSERGTKGWFRYAGKSIRPVRDFDKGGAVSTSGTDAAENGVSQAKRENLSGDAVIDGSFSDNITVGPGRRLEIKGSCSGNVRICRRSVLVCRGSCSGNVDIEHEGRFECYGPMSGNITNHRGTVDIHGPFTGTRRDV